MTENKIEHGKQRLWYTRRDDTIKGPFPSGTIRRFVVLGRVLLTDEVSSDQQQWQLVKDVPEVVSPAIRKAIVEGDTAYLLAARLCEDERAGRERRTVQGDIGFAQQRKDERRRLEPDLLQKHRTAKTDLRELKRQRKFPIMGMIAVTFPVLAAIGFGLLRDVPPTEPDPDCAARASPGINWRNCLLDRLHAESGDLRGATLNNARLREARLSGTNLSHGDLQYADFSGADLSYTDLSGALMKGTELRGSDLSNADLTNTDLSFANLTGANLGGADITTTRFDNAIWTDGVRCEVGSVGGCGTAHK